MMKSVLQVFLVFSQLYTAETNENESLFSLVYYLFSRKESSRRDPVKRPDIMKMRRESLGQILLLRKGLLTPAKHKMVLRERQQQDLSCSPGNSPIVFSPRSKKRPAPIPMDMGEAGNGSDTTGNTPSKKSIKLDHFTPKEKMPPPPVANVQLRGQCDLTFGAGRVKVQIF